MRHRRGDDGLEMPWRRVADGDGESGAESSMVYAWTNRDKWRACGRGDVRGEKQGVEEAAL